MLNVASSTFAAVFCPLTHVFPLVLLYSLPPPPLILLPSSSLLSARPSAITQLSLIKTGFWGLKLNHTQFIKHPHVQSHARSPLTTTFDLLAAWLMGSLIKLQTRPSILLLHAPICFLFLSVSLMTSSLRSRSLTLDFHLPLCPLSFPFPPPSPSVSCKSRRPLLFVPLNFPTSAAWWMSDTNTHTHSDRVAYA